MRVLALPYKQLAGAAQLQTEMNESMSHPAALYDGVLQ
jgi:hypothetical protein